MKFSQALVGVIILGSALTACGDDDGGDSGASSEYCKDLRSASADLKTLSDGDVAEFDNALATMHKLADEAPGDIKDDWAVLDGAVTKIEDAFSDAGIELSDLEEIQAGRVPEGVDASKLASLGATLNDINSEKYTDASKNIEKHAKDTCNVDLNE